MRLTDLSLNERASIVAIEGGYGIRRHPALRGLASGCTIATLDGETLVLGRGTAQKIQVRKV